MKRSLGRRAFLGGLGVTTAASTFLRPILVQSQTGAAPQRLLMIHRPCGSAMNANANPGAPSFWWPTSGASGGIDWVVAPGGLIDSFNAVRNQMVVMKGVHCPRVPGWHGDKHGGGMLAMISPSPKHPGNDDAWPIIPGREAEAKTNTEGKWFTATDRSIDQLFLSTIATLKSLAAIPSISLTPDLISAQPDNFCIRVVSYAKDNPNAAQPTPLNPLADPVIAFKNLFGNAMMGMDDAAIARAAAQDKSVIDFINGDLNSLRPRLPKLAKDKVDTHLAALRQLELQLGKSSGRMCTQPTLVPVDSRPVLTRVEGDDINEANDARYHQAALEQFKIIKTAFQCDLTRVATFTFGYGNSGIRYKNVIPALLPDVQMDDVEGYHSVSHNGGMNPHQGQFLIDKYHCTMTANLLADLAATPDGVNGGSLLDNTLVVFWNECSVGADHGWEDMPVLLFGGKFLNLQGGHYFDFGTQVAGKGRFMSDVWTATSMKWSDAEGVKGTGYQPLVKYGADQWNTGGMTELFG